MDKNKDVHPYVTAHDVIVSIWWRMFFHKIGIFCPNYPLQLCHYKALNSSIPSRSNNENHFSHRCSLIPFDIRISDWPFNSKSPFGH